jgi:REP element-mobilizing transposase RayT
MERVPLSHKGWHSRGYLPHFDNGAVVQTATFRLADSLPRSLYKMAAAASVSDEDRRDRLGRILDEGRGSCILKYPENASIVRAALEYFDGARYRLLAWVVMPNHVHTMVEQIAGNRLGDIVHSWKSYSANAINACAATKGPVWSPDYFDRYVRDGRHCERAIRYIEDNPVKAGLVAQAADWPFSSAAGRWD